MKVWVLRHGEAEPYGSRPDSERALTPHGCEEALRSAARTAFVRICFVASASALIRASTPSSLTVTPSAITDTRHTHQL